MNYVFIKEFIDLKILLEAQWTTSIDKEYDILKNCWAISLDRAFSKKITTNKLKNF